MKIQNFNGSVVLEKKKPVEKHASQPNVQHAPKDKPLSFMSIPSMAFMGKLVVPNLPKGININPAPVIQRTSKLQENAVEPTVDYKVYPQDPLITKPEIYQLKGEVAVGPENKRIKAQDTGSEVAKPDEKGNYLCDTETAQFERVNSFVFVNKVLNLYEKELGRKINWGFQKEQLDVLPRAGEDMNAYYSRWDNQIGLYYYKNPQDPSETCRTSKMADVITHEAGHATLDGLRPGYFGWGSAGGAVHEGFSDCTAMLVAMQNENLLDTVIKMTGGDLKKENYIASLAEQFGKSYYGDKMYLRNAINNLKHSDYDSGRESKQVHNYGRLMAGTLYDVITEMAAANGLKDNPKEALIKTREDVGKILARAMGDFSPQNNVYFSDVAKALLQADKHVFNGKYKNLLSKVLINRELLKPGDIKAWEDSVNNLPDMTLPPSGISSVDSLVSMLEGNKEKLGLSKDKKYEIESAYTNTHGETFVSFKSTTNVPFQFEGETYSIDLSAGVTLGFNNEGKLFFAQNKKLDSFDIDDSIWDAKNELKKMQDMQDKGLPIKHPNVYMIKGAKSNKLVKTPRIEDPANK